MNSARQLCVRLRRFSGNHDIRAVACTPQRNFSHDSATGARYENRFLTQVIHSYGFHIDHLPPANSRHIHGNAEKRRLRAPYLRKSYLHFKFISNVRFNYEVPLGLGLACKRGGATRSARLQTGSRTWVAHPLLKSPQISRRGERSTPTNECQDSSDIIAQRPRAPDTTPHTVRAETNRSTA